jgi:site-specific recombinase XerC
LSWQVNARWFPHSQERAAVGAHRLNEVAFGRNPAAEKQAAKKAEADAKAATFKAVARMFIERHARPKTPRSAKQTEGRLKPAVRRWGNRPINDIRKRDVIALLDDTVDRGAPVMANNVFAVVRKLFNWVVAKDILLVSPCTGVEAPRQA